MLVPEKELARIRAEIARDPEAEYEKIRRGDLLDLPRYQCLLDVTRDERMQWWREARFGIFMHFGIYSARGAGEWELASCAVEPDEYLRSAENFAYQSGAAREWARIAREAGAKYMVLTTRHHDGFSLWDSKINLYNSVNYGPHIDIVREYVEACRAEGLKIGLYSTLMDWHNPDFARSTVDPDARRRFLDYTYELNRELLTNYGKIDILWYDGIFLLDNSIGWDALRMNQRLRALQPHILLNDRAGLPEDFTTPEERVVPNKQDWESCMTFNQISWGYVDEKLERNYQYSPQQIVRMLFNCAAGGGNLLLNVGPDPTGKFPDSITEKLRSIGQWLRANGEAIYGIRRKYKRFADGAGFGEFGGGALTWVTAQGETVYLGVPFWPKDGSMVVAGYAEPPKRIRLLHNGEELSFRFDGRRIRIVDLPPESPEPILQIPVIVLEFDEIPAYRYAGACAALNNGNTVFSASK